MTFSQKIKYENYVGHFFCLCLCISLSGCFSEKKEHLIYAEGANVFSDSLILIWGKSKENGRFIVRDAKTNKKKIEFSFDNLIASSNRFLAKRNSKWAILKIDGSPITNFLYDSINIYEDLIIAKSNNKWGLINENGIEILPFKYDEIKLSLQYEIISQNVVSGIKVDSTYFMVRNDKLYNFVTKNGKYLINQSYEYVDDFIDGIAVVKKNNLWYCINKNGKFICKIPTKFFKNSDFEDGSRYLRTTDVFSGWQGEQTFYYFDKFKNNICQISSPDAFSGIYTYENPAIINKFNKNNFIAKGRNINHSMNNIGICDDKKKWIIQPIYSFISRPDKTGFAIVGKEGKEGVKFGIIDESGKQIKPIIFDKLPFTYGVTLMGKSDYHFLVNMENKKVSDIYFRPSSYTLFGRNGNNLYTAITSLDTGFIDLKGKYYSRWIDK